MTRRTTAPGRTRRVALSRDAILEAALAVARREGVDARSIRKLAAARGLQARMSYTRGSAGLRDVTELVEDLAAPTGSEAFAEGFEIVLAGLGH